MDSNCYKANSKTKYEAYFDLLHLKIEEYNILLYNTYNMDEKGFLISVIGHSKRVFS
ncbi:hypothetical protein BU23DRAFT_455149 [Bimuria novae-zelandiae CBS 107.79]|uniref:DDE-1 domain-containing protein n=1 Tax=Bimuria novae-zelandiae CBS 107.79 TaxID=1447943 RepID=A0A6A5VTP0_9PLEO|nr:hypothetical protein BU23DRAFT_455149 [Bimuria novae-zelandiae CBS 107.79]